MQMPNINSTHDYYHYWMPVKNGNGVPDEWQSTLMNLVEDALNQGVFYSDDMRKWVKEHADFIPSTWWDLQYSRTPVEGGIMGMEVYSARCAVKNKKEREENEEALKNIEVGKEYGSLCVNGKRVNKCVVKSINNYSVVLSGVTGRYACEVTTSAKNISRMISNAVNRGWRKQ
jgi:hypothetical protein